MSPNVAAATPFRFPLKPLSPSVMAFRNKSFVPEGCSAVRWAKTSGLDFACNSQGKSFPPNTVVSSLLFTGDQAGLSLTVPWVSGRCTSMTRRQAYIYHSSGFRIPATAEKPVWWWRTLSCIPYLLALQMSETGLFLQPFVEKYIENLVFFIPGAVKRLPSWFQLIYFYFAIFGVVKNRDWPLFFRFHVMMGFLLETGLQLLWISSNFMPLVHYNGTFGVYYWAGVALAYILLLLGCVRCALLGTFVNIPVLSESAFIHSLFNLGGFQRPF